MSLGTPVDDLIAEIGCAGDPDTVIQLQRRLTAEVQEHWRSIARGFVEGEGYERIGEEAERILRAARERRAELAGGLSE